MMECTHECALALCGVCICPLSEGKRELQTRPINLHGVRHPKATPQTPTHPLSKIGQSRQHRERESSLKYGPSLTVTASLQVGMAPCDMEISTPTNPGWWRISVPYLVLIGAVISAACANVALGPRGLALGCRGRHPQPPLIERGVADEATLYDNATFVCPPPVPCPAVFAKGRDGPQPTDNGTMDRDVWDLSRIPLAYLSRKQLGKPGVCTVETTQRVFRESGVDAESLMRFQPCELFNLIQRRTLWIFGDSQLLGLHRTLHSFMSEFASTEEDAHREVEIGIPSVDYVLTYSENPKHKSRPLCIALKNDTRICYVRLLRGTNKELQYALELLARAIPNFLKHVVIFNLGLHYQEKRYLLSRDLQAIADYRHHVRLTMGESFLPMTLWIDTPPQHFSLPRGMYDSRRNLTGDSCLSYDDAFFARGDRGPFNAISDDYVSNVSDAHVQAWDLAERSYFAHLHAGTTYRTYLDAHVEGIHMGMRRINFGVILRPFQTVFFLSLKEMLPPPHNKTTTGDCTHYCNPGVPELWIFALTKVLAQTRPGCQAGT